MALGQAPLGLWYVALPVLALLMRRVAAAPGERAAGWTGLFAGAGYFGLSLNWIVAPFLVDPWHYAWMIPFAVLAMCFGLALFWAAAAAGSAGFARDRLLAFAVLLGLAELARGYVLTGFPWALVGHVWLETPLAQAGALIGPSGLNLLTLLAVAGLAGALPGQPLGQRLGQRMGSALAGGALLAGLAAYGGWRLSLPEPAAPGVVIRLVQPDAEQEMKWDPDKARFYFDRLLAFTAAAPQPDMTVWPETALPYLLDPEGQVVGLIAEAAAGRPVVVGLQRVAGERGFNSLAVIGADGRLGQTYDKRHLVPFGEYIPFGDIAYDLLGLRAFAAQLGNGYSAGGDLALLDLGGRLGRALPLICYEAVFPQDLRGTARADWILQATNDAWFGTWSGPWQHLAQARMRAIEQGLPLARVANTGVTAMIDARGRITAALEQGVASYLDAPLPGAMAETPYAKWGEGPVIVMLGGLIALLLVRRRRGLA